MHSLVFHPAVGWCLVTTTQQLSQTVLPSGRIPYSFGNPLLDRYLEIVPELRGAQHVVEKDPEDVKAADGLEFLAHQHGDRCVVRFPDRESGLSARTITPRRASVSVLYSYLVARWDTSDHSNPVSITRCPVDSQPVLRGSARTRMVPLVRVSYPGGTGPWPALARRLY